MTVVGPIPAPNPSQAALQVRITPGEVVEPLQGALILFLQGGHHLEELGGGLEVVPGVAAFVQQDHQVVPPLGQDGLGGINPLGRKDLVGAAGQLAGDPGPIEDGRQKPPLAGCRSRTQVNPQFNGKAAGILLQHLGDQRALRRLL